MTKGELFPRAPAERLATLRILTGTFALAYLSVRATTFLDLRRRPAASFDPVGVLAWMRSPAPDWCIDTVLLAALVTGFCFVIGAAFRTAGPSFAVAVLLLTTYRSSFGQVLWLENLMVLHLLIVGVAPSADALVLGKPSPNAAAGEEYGVPVRLAALVTVATYVVAGVAKLRIGGLDWVTSDTLGNHVAGTALRADLLGAASSPVGRWLAQFGWAFRPVAGLALVLELAAPLALAGRRIRDVWVGLSWAMHVAIAATMYVVFPYPLFLVAFAPLYDLEKLRSATAWRPGAWHARRGHSSLAR